MRFPRVWTLGYGSMSKEAFLGLLKGSGIQVVVDVRRWPTSKLDHFKRENMERWLSEAGIRYLWLGEQLGGYRSGGYEAYMGTEPFQAGIEGLLALAKGERICILCLELDPRRCHRRFIADYLQGMGVEVIHLRKEKAKPKPSHVGSPG